MKIEVWTHDRKDANGNPEILLTYIGLTVPEIGSWIAIGKGEGGAFPTWRVVKVIHIPELEMVSIQVSY